MLATPTPSLSTPHFTHHTPARDHATEDTPPAVEINSVDISVGTRHLYRVVSRCHDSVAWLVTREFVCVMLCMLISVHLSAATLSPTRTRPCLAWHLLPPIPIPQEYHRRDVQASGGRLRPSNEEAKSRRSGVNRRPPPTWAPMYPHCVMSPVLQPKCDLHRIAYTCTCPLPCLWEQCAGLCAGSSRLQSLRSGWVVWWFVV